MNPLMDLQEPPECCGYEPKEIFDHMFLRACDICGKISQAHIVEIKR